jgi:uncharacterized protein with HEPN domain
MSEHIDIVYLNHILETIEKIEKYTRGLSKDSILKDENLI